MTDTVVTQILPENGQSPIAIDYNEIIFIPSTTANSSAPQPVAVNQPSSVREISTNIANDDTTKKAIDCLVRLSQQPQAAVKTIVDTYIQQSKEIGVEYDHDSIVQNCLQDVFLLPPADENPILVTTTSSTKARRSSVGNDKAIVVSDNDRYDMDIPDDIEIMSAPKVIDKVSIVLSIFPTAKATFIQQTLAEHNDDANVVIQIFAEKGFEKEPVQTTSSKNESKTAPKKDFNNLNSFEPSAVYKEQLQHLLQANFPYIFVGDLRTLANNEKYKHHYAIIYQYLEKSLEIEGIFEGLSNHTSAELLAKKDKATAIGLRLKATKSTPMKLDQIDPILKEEIAFLREMKLKKREESDHQMAMQINEEIAIAEGSMYECGCCYSEYPFESMVQCSEGHVFCKSCLQRYVETSVFSDGKTQLSCMNTGSEACCGYFPDSMLRASLSDVVFQKYQEALARDVIKKADLVLVTCYNCSFAAELTNDAGNILTCPSCGKETCKLCGEASHVPLKCSEVEKKGETNARLTVEEAMTQARVRECPKCKTRFYKTEGCNKMSCSCGTKICYICRADITKPQYQHFCQTPNCQHQSCGKCVLFTNSIEDDRLAMYEAGQKALQQQTDSGGEKIELNKLIEGGTAPVAKKARVGGGIAVAHPAANPMAVFNPIPMPAVFNPIPPLPPQLPFAVGANIYRPPRRNNNNNRRRRGR